MSLQEAKVLVIEDNPDDIFFIRRLLNDPAGPKFSVEHATRLEVGLALLARQAFDAVLLDLMLPDSLNADTFLRVRERSPRTPVVILTGVQDEAMALSAMARGAQDYLVKGTLDARLLKRSLAYAIERKRLSTRLETVVAAAMEGIVVLDEGGVVRFMNPAAGRILGCEPDRAVGRPFSHRLSPDETQRIRVRPAEGETRLVETRLSEVDWDGARMRLALLRDVTDVLRLEQLKVEVRESRKAEQLKERFVGFLSQELRSPVAILKAAFETVQNSFAAQFSEQQQGLMRLAEKDLTRLTRLSRLLLDLARLESGKAEPDPRPTHLGPLLRGLAEDLLAEDPGRGVEVRVDAPAELPTVYADREMMEQLFGQLIENALRHARARVVIEARAVGGDKGVEAVEVSVGDDGPPIPRERLGDLFQKFSPAGRPEDAPGAGLGLALCKEIVRLHRGRIWAASEGGEGAEFRCALPRDWE